MKYIEYEGRGVSLVAIFYVFVNQFRQIDILI